MVSGDLPLPLLQSPWPALLPHKPDPCGPHCLTAPHSFVKVLVNMALGAAGLHIWLICPQKTRGWCREGGQPLSDRCLNGILWIKMSQIKNEWASLSSKAFLQSVLSHKDPTRQPAHQHRVQSRSFREHIEHRFLLTLKCNVIYHLQR